MIYLFKKFNTFCKASKSNYDTVIPLPLEMQLTCENIKKHNLSNESYIATTNITNIKTKIPFS